MRSYQEFLDNAAGSSLRLQGKDSFLLFQDITARLIAEGVIGVRVNREQPYFGKKCLT